MNESTTPASGQARELIAFRVGEQEFCVDIMAVRELRGWTQTTPLPDTPAYVRGVINLRGSVLPVIDLAARIGFSSTEVGARHVIIVVCIGVQLVGLLVDSVCDILTVTDDGLRPTPTVTSDTLRAFVAALVTVDDRMIGLLALDQLLPAVSQAA
ncbi:MAG: cheW [Caulobacteraceae bacterium]|nr:cheW [Caulobacteraceae bacterium]